MSDITTDNSNHFDDIDELVDIVQALRKVGIAELVSAKVILNIDHNGVLQNIEVRRTAYRRKRNV